jgi:hypothetical protein
MTIQVYRAILDTTRRTYCDPAIVEVSEALAGEALVFRAECSGLENWFGTNTLIKNNEMLIFMERTYWFLRVRLSYLLWDITKYERHLNPHRQ